MDTVRRRLLWFAAAAALVAVALLAGLHGCDEATPIRAAPRVSGSTPPSAAEPARPAPPPRKRNEIIAAGDSAADATPVVVEVSHHTEGLKFEPVPGATVVLRQAGRTDRSATTGADGTVTFDLVPGGDIELQATAPGYVQRGGGAGDRSRMCIVMQRATAVTGIVLDARTGRPVAGAEVVIAGGPSLQVDEQELFVLPPREDAESYRVLGSATSGADGRFVIDGVTPFQPVIVTARAAGLGVGRAEAAAPPLDKPSRPVEVRVGPTGTLTGRVLDANGQPVAGALAGAVPTSKPDEVSDLADGSSFDSRLGTLVRRIVRADREGRFRIEGLPLDTMLTVVGKGPKAPSPPVSDVLLTAERPERSLDLTIGGFGAVVVRVLRPDGTPAEGSWVDVETSHMSWTDQEMTEHTFGNIAPGTRSVTARAPGFPPVTTKADVRDGETTKLDVRLVPGLCVSGRVIDADGHAVEGATVRASGPGGSWASDTTTADGRFRLDGLLLGRHRLEATHDTLGTRAGEVEVVADAPAVSLTIPRNGDLRVDVADAEAAPVKSAWVVMTGPVRRASFTNEKGTFTQRLPPGRYRVAFEYGGDANAAVEIEVKAGEETLVRLRTE